MMDKKNLCFTIYPLDRDIERTWFVRVTDHLGRSTKKYGHLSKFHTVEDRLTEAHRIITALQAPGVKEIKPCEDLIRHLSAVLETRRPRLEKSTYLCYFSQVKLFATWYRPAYAKDKQIDPGAYVNYLFERGHKKNYIRKLTVVLRDFFNVLVKDHIYHKNPFTEIRIKKQKGKSLLPFHANDVAVLKKLMLENDPQLWDVCLFQYYLFFRPNEIRQLRIRDILFHDMKVIASDEILKDDDNYLKKIPLPMQPMINKYRGYNPNYFIFSKNGLPGPVMLSYNNFRIRHARLRELANLSTRYALYSWVHTGIKNAAMAGIPHKQLQLQKGHSDLKMFDEYLKNLGIDDCIQLEQNFPAV